MNLAIGSDHAGFKLKNELLVHLIEKGLELQDFGPDTADSVDYPDYAHKVAESVASGENDLGILICLFFSGSPVRQFSSELQPESKH